jgi:predicted AAA+ superfamily ATPase
VEHDGTYYNFYNAASFGNKKSLKQGKIFKKKSLKQGKICTFTENSQEMTVLYRIFEERLRRTSLDFKRYLYSTIDWNSRMFGIVGPLGVGKTMLVLQHIKENHSNSDTLYVSMDDLYFVNHTLYDTAEQFHKDGGKYLFIDEIHKYPA